MIASLNQAAARTAAEATAAVTAAVEACVQCNLLKMSAVLVTLIN
jgi:hypothetical protein